MIVFLSDNGAPFPREKVTLYDGGTRTPLIFSWPRVVPPHGAAPVHRRRRRREPLVPRTPRSRQGWPAHGSAAAPVRGAPR
ncbi:MAG: hypothetical protein H0T50_05200, partial [Gemmatimonadales bacterium]|nr:hypothetical protein [Gemmatimonadales bacterium]